MVEVRETCVVWQAQQGSGVMPEARRSCTAAARLGAARCARDNCLAVRVPCGAARRAALSRSPAQQRQRASQLGQWQCSREA
jgi:hypothetical protein